MPLCQLQLHEVQLEGAFCKLCAMCTICGGPLTAVEFDWCWKRATKNEEQPVFEHPGCFSEADRLKVSNEQVTIPRSLFDKLNAARLLLEPLEGLSGKTNRQDAEIKVQHWLIDYSLEQQMLFLHKMEAAASMAYQLLSKNAGRRDIEDLLKERERTQFSQAIKERDQHAVKAPSTKARVEKRKLTQEEKLIETFMSCGGLSRADATAQVEAMKAKKGDSL